ncbi:putative vegetative incompatibility protein HET-E-1 [Rosellinia necatrix]|uniref:Putative vegetative incompatibility protein HET-E-1 n=1 Tax=Rosellinia necatrix TaxID=77044 RepID=A0A1S8A5Y9_ROSNE|nr:putative vegetative incompatibility protein HET-E-1 [Rosellinia necatrix]
MGGLVIKKAYVLACQTPEYSSLATRICAVFFLATPHQGAGVAQLLSRFLSLSGPRPFVRDLFPESSMLQTINEQFPRYSECLQLFSFYETKPMYYGVGKGLIVEKHCAVMNYTNERRIYLDANHRDVARFSTPSDPSYILVRNALATVIDSRRAPVLPVQKRLQHVELAALSKFLGVSGAPEDKLITNESRKLPGSCEWLIQKESFQQWRNALTSRIFWLRGRPGAGKTVLASHVTSHIRALGLDCCYFFFTHGDEEKGTVNALLRSMAWQMAVMHSDALTAILTVTDSWEECAMDKVDHIAVWHRIFANAILEVKLSRPQYWVIDALDECRNSQELMFFLRKAQERWPLCILITSRNGIETYLSATTPSMEVISEDILEDNKQDIASFLSANLDRIPCATTSARQDVSDQILRNSRGCFLWVSLVLEELRQVYTAADISRVLDNDHSDMDALYARIVNELSRAKFGKDLARTILTWATCAFRPLSVNEIRPAVELDIRDSIDDIEKSIGACGNLVFIDKAKKVQFVHLTAREFLTRKDISSEFTIDKSVAHKRLALVCIQTLCENRGNSKEGSGTRRVANNTTGNTESALYDYASTYIFQHALQVETTNNEIFVELAKFLSSREVLVWIEYLVKKTGLQRIYQAGESCKSLVSCRVYQTQPIDTRKQLLLVERWGIDLVRLVNKFGNKLYQFPSSIYSLIPPFCPSESVFRKQFVNAHYGLNVQGCIPKDWDDYLCAVPYPCQAKPTNIASSRKNTAVMLLNRVIVVYDNTTMLETNTFNHQEPIWTGSFSENGKLFASGGTKTVRVWNLDSSEQIISCKIPAMCMSMAFIEYDDILLIATNNNLVIYWDIPNNTLKGEAIDWTIDLLDTEPQLQARRPTMAAFSTEQNLLAIAYKGEDIILWTPDGNRIYDMYEKGNGSYRSERAPTVLGKVSVLAFAFGSTIGSNLLAVAYADGDVVIYDTDSGECRGSLVEVNAQTMACSPDGRILATADSRGNIDLFNLQTLKFMHRVRLDIEAIGVKKISFMPDNLRLLSIGGKQFTVWDSTMLFQQDPKDSIIDNGAYSALAQPPEREPVELERSPEDVPITAMVCMRETTGVIYGKDDGSVRMYSTPSQPHGQELFIQTKNRAITVIHFDDDSDILTCGDTTGRVTSRKLIRKSQNDWISGEIIFDKTGQSSISQVIASAKHDRVLVSTVASDAVWSLAATSATRCIACVEGSPKQRWLTSAMNEDLLVRFSTGIATIYQWASLTPIGSVELVLGENVPLRFESIVLFQHPQYFASIHVFESDRWPSTRVYHLWDLRDLTSKAQTENGTISPVLYFWRYKLDRVIGVVDERAVFMTSDNWFCSVRIVPHGRESTQHFFVPGDWMRSRHEIPPELRPSGEVVIAKRTDVVIIRRGFEVRNNKDISSGRHVPNTWSIPR